MDTNPAKVLFINDFRSYSGAESHLETLAQGLKTLGVETSFWIAAEHKGSWSDCIERERPDLLHIHNFWQIPSPEWEALFHTGLPIILSLHDYGIACPQRHRLLNFRRCPIPCNYECGRRELIDQFPALLRDVTLVTFNEGSREIFTAQGIEGVKVIPHGIDLNRWQWRPLADRHGIGFVQGERLNWWKGYTAAEYVAAELGRPLISARGGRPHAEVLGVYQKCAVYLNFCIYDDTFGLTTIEAAACGAPIVSYATTGARVILGEDYPGLVSIGDVGAGLEATRRFLEAPPDTWATRERLERLFTLERMAQDWLKLYKATIPSSSVE